MLAIVAGYCCYCYCYWCVWYKAQCVLRACPENEPSDKGLSIVLKGRNHSRNDDDVIVPYHCYQECNDDTDQTIPKYRPILCYAIRTKTQSVRFVLLSIHFQHKYNRLMWMNNRIFSVWISAYYFISRHTLFFYLSLSSFHSFPLVLVLLLVFSLSHLLSSYAVWFAVWTKHDLDCIAIAFVRHANRMNNSVIWFCSRTRPNIVYCARTTH